MSARRDPDPRLRSFARAMRREPSDAERKLRGILRDRRLGGFKFRRQVPAAGYVLDFYCEAASTAVELDGEQHAEPNAVQYDERRTARLAELRILVLRFPSREMVAHPESVAKTILRILTTGA